MRRRAEQGFTLMELMVVIVIVAILAAVAVPLYVNYVKDAQRTEAKGAIGAIISAQQVYYQNKRVYLTEATDSGAIETGLGIDLTDSKVNWGFSIRATDDETDGFMVIADGNNGTRGEASPAKDLVVTYTHSRASGPTWSEEAPPPVVP